jgi:predicted nucleic acid-binding Zn ribbon protein
MSTQPPKPGQPQVPDPAAIHCPRCSTPIGPDQDWCLECGAPARTRLAQTPNWQLPTVAIGAIVLLAGALLAFAFVKLTNDNGATPAATTAAPAVVDTAPPAVVPPPVTAPVPSATTTAPSAPIVPSTVPGQTTPVAPPSTATTPAPKTTTGGQKTVPPFGSTTTTPTTTTP